MPVLLRLLLALVIAVVMTFAVFLAMQSLIHSGPSVLDNEPATRLINFVDVSQDDDVQTKQRKPKKPPTPPAEPPKPNLPTPDLNIDNNAKGLDISGVEVATDLAIDAGLSGGTGDGDYLPIVKVAPQYPRRVAQRGIEGYVVLEFTVNALGAVEKPVVIESKPPNIFDRAAISAALRFKYKPRIIDGKAQVSTGVRNIIRFQLDKSQKR